MSLPLYLYQRIYKFVKTNKPKIIMSITLVEKYQSNKSGTISIKPYFEQNISNMGLEKYGMNVFDGVFHEEQLTCIEINGIKRYATGLNEFAPEVKLLPDDEREAKIKQIRNIVAQLEKDLAANIVDIDDKEFWNKVKLLRPDNHTFWEKITLRVGNEPTFLDPKGDPYDLIKLYAIEAGGFSLVAKSYEAAKRMAKPPKFYLDRLETTVGTKTEYKKLRNKALSELQKLFDKNTNKLFLVAKVVDIDSVQYKKSTPNDILFDNMDRHINGEGSEDNKKRAAEKFLEIAGYDMETLKIKALIKDATYYKVVAHKSDGFIYHLESSTMLGRNSLDVLEFLKNPLNDQILLDISKKVEKFWNS
jgi:hypothetical protein